MPRFTLLASLGLAFAFVGPVAAQKDKPKKSPATEPEALRAPAGFKINLVLTADPAAQGSWIGMTKDNKGRLIIGGQRGQPVLRVTLKDGKAEKVEKLDLGVSEVMGLLYAFDSLYLNAAGKEGFGLYKYADTDGNGTFSTPVLLKKFEGAGEHGPHGLALGNDKKIYVMNGNHTKLPDGLSKESQYKNYKEDLLLPRQWDGNGHAAGIYAPGGYVVRTDADGKNWELVLGGFRNAYDIAFNGDGELFTFDSDMEWDWGMPWYRPTRVNHCVVGSEHGWRSGTGVWPGYYPDNLPATADIGIGSPTGVGNGIGAKFPAKYQKALYICDWSYGRLLAVHLTPKGASYVGAVENFVVPAGLVEPNAPRKPLNLTDLTVGDDGAMYFTIGGRNTQAALYRVTYTGSESTAPANLHDEAGAKDRQLRHELEAFHGKVDPKAVAFAWPYLSHPDRFIRFAARVAIESQPVAEWQSKALAEKEPVASLTALLALCRNGDPKVQPEILAALAKLPFASLVGELKADKLRVFGVCCTRMGRPSIDAAKKVIAELDPAFPTGDRILDREVSQVLIYLNAPGIAAKCLKLMKEAAYSEDVMHYVFHLRTLPVGFWTMEQRKEYLSYFTKDRLKALPHDPAVLSWFAFAGRQYGDGASYGNFLKNFLREAVVNMSDAERKELDPIVASINKAALPNYDVKPRATVKAWTLAELQPQLANVEKGRDFNKGREAYFAAQCIKCHKFGDDGGSVGPDLTSIATRFDRKAILESVVEPSKVLSDQYQNEQINSAAGTVITGRVVDESSDKIVVQPNPLLPDRVEVKKADIDSRKPSKVSPMPDHLIDVLTADELLDLIAFLESGGNKGYRAFQKR